MKKLFSTTAAAIAFYFLLFSFTSCQKNTSSEDNLTETAVVEMSEESSTAEDSYTDADDVAQITTDEDGSACEAARGGANGGRYQNPFAELRRKLGPCATITVTPNDTTYPRTIKVDFGAGCLCADGKFRSGALVLHLTNALRKSGAVGTLTFDNYSVNRVALKGSKIFTNQSTINQYKVGLASANCSVQFPNGRGYTYNSNKTITQVEGNATPLIIRDDVFTITTRSQTTYKNGTVITITTDTALTKKATCNWVSAGALSITVNSRELKLNYGYPNNGDCDNKALLSWNNGANTKEIKLP